MQRHPYFDLLLHEEAELSAWLNDEVVERLTLHEWPLSCVHRLTCASGSKVIYKATRQPSVEPEFYAAARSPLLVSARTVYRQKPYACLLVEYLECPTLDKVSMTEKDAVALGRHLLTQIGAIQGDLPYTLDIASRERWLNYVAIILEGLQSLLQAGSFVQCRQDMVVRLERWACSQAVLAAVEAHAGYVHSDLVGDNIFSQAGVWKVIDWQRPILGPVELDLATLLASLGFRAEKYVPGEIVAIQKFLHIGWFCECATRWFPPGVETYDRQIAVLAQLIA